jgi:catalase
LQLAGDGDPTDDPRAVWPDDRETVEAGTLEIVEPDTEREKGDDILVFDPTRVTDGIELSDDQILRFRREAYNVSIKRRSGVGLDDTAAD